VGNLIALKDEMRLPKKPVQLVPSCSGHGRIV